MESSIREETADQHSANLTRDTGTMVPAAMSAWYDPAWDTSAGRLPTPHEASLFANLDSCLAVTVDPTLPVSTWVITPSTTVLVNDVEYEVDQASYTSTMNGPTLEITMRLVPKVSTINISFSVDPCTSNPVSDVPPAEERFTGFPLIPSDMVNDMNTQFPWIPTPEDLHFLEDDSLEREMQVSYERKHDLVHIPQPRFGWR